MDLNKVKAYNLMALVILVLKSHFYVQKTSSRVCRGSLIMWKTEEHLEYSSDKESYNELQNEGVSQKKVTEMTT